MPNLISKMTEYAFQNTEAKRLFAPVLAPNKASMRILEKNGFKLEGVNECEVYRESEGGFLDEYLCARIKH
ncbi:MAG: GNAT family N-acetyltransferase [Acidiferrobacterales bacterium]|nr:GNAT family N-acetyltransferase [Acidiferrobacterales bacterium]